MNYGQVIFNQETFKVSNPADRIVSRYKDIKDTVSHLKGLGLKVVLTQGTWDLIHIGHARYLETARSHGDVLIVGVDDDDKVKHRKGPDRPVVPESERLEMLTHMRSVDLVVLKKKQDPKWSLVKTVTPDVLITIPETYTPKQLKDLKRFCGEVIVLDRQATTSTSAKIRLLQINVAQKLGQAITPKLVKTIEETLDEIKNGRQ